MKVVDTRNKTLVVTLFRGADARSLLKDSEFVNHWRELAQQCPWATVYQSVDFAKVWYECYEEVYDPILVVARDESALAGLFLLAQSHTDRSLVHVGSMHAEYQGWLALPGRSAEFVIEGANVCKTLGAGILKLHFAAPKISLDWVPTVQRAGVHVSIEMHRRGLMAVDAGSAARASLRKKGNRSKLTRLARQGPVSLVQLYSSEDLRNVLDDISEFCDLRQGAINDSTPFRSDPRKRRLYLELMDLPNVLHATVLMAGPVVVAAHIGPIDKEYVSLGLIAHSPFAAAQSPAKLLLYLLAERLSDQGYRVFDLTPGGDYKDRFASEEDTVPSICFFLSKWSYLRFRIERALVGTAKRIANFLGVDARSFGNVAVNTARTVLCAARRSHRVALGSLRLAAKWVHSSGEFRIYGIQNDVGLKLGVESARIQVNSIADLLQYKPAAPGDSSEADFFKEALRRLEVGQKVFTYANNGLLLHYSWLIPITERCGSEYGHEIVFKQPAAVLWNDYTHPKARGLGLHQESIRVRAHHVATNQLALNVVSGVRSDNGPSRHNFEKLGFKHVGSAYLERRLGKSKRWITGTFLSEPSAE